MSTQSPIDETRSRIKDEQSQRSSNIRSIFEFFSSKSCALSEGDFSICWRNKENWHDGELQGSPRFCEQYLWFFWGGIPSKAVHYEWWCSSLWSYQRRTSVPSAVRQSCEWSRDGWRTNWEKMISLARRHSSHRPHPNNIIEQVKLWSLYVWH